MSNLTQEQMEALFSQRNIHDVLHSSITYQLNKAFLTWTLGAYLRIEEYLEGSYYTSKMLRIQVLKEYINSNGLEPILVALLAATIRSKKNQTIQQVIGYLQTHLPHDDHFDRARTAAELIAVCSGPQRLFMIDRPINDKAPIVIVNHWATLYKLFDSEFEFIDDTFYNPPLIKPPKKVTNSHSCGYYTINEAVILGKHTQHSDNLDFETLNILGRIPWVLDKHIKAMQEVPPKEPRTAIEADNFQKHTQQARRIYDVLGSKPFWIAWQFDSRGRVYSHGYHVNLQSYEYKKAILNFDHYEVITQ